MLSIRPQAMSPSPSNSPATLPQFAAPALPHTAPLLTLPVGLLGKPCMVLPVAATTPEPRFALVTLTVEFNCHCCSVNGGGPQYDMLALVESADST